MPSPHPNVSRNVPAIHCNVIAHRQLPFTGNADDDRYFPVQFLVYIDTLPAFAFVRGEESPHKFGCAAFNVWDAVFSGISSASDSVFAFSAVSLSVSSLGGMDGVTFSGGLPAIRLRR